MSYCRIDRRSGRVTQRAGSVAGLQGYDPLGFSLKPPKWIRKAQPGKFVQKHALAIAAVGASFLIPGVAPLALKAVTGAGKLAFGGARGLVTGAKVLGRGTAGLLKSKLPTIANRPAAPSPGILAQIFRPAAPTPAPGAATALLPPAAAASVMSAPDSMGPPMSMAPASSGSGGGGGSPESAATESAAQPAQAGLGAGALAIGALVVFGLMSTQGKRKR